MNASIVKYENQLFSVFKISFISVFVNSSVYLSKEIFKLLKEFYKVNSFVDPNSHLAEVNSIVSQCTNCCCASRRFKRSYRSRIILSKPAIWTCLSRIETDFINPDESTSLLKACCEYSFKPVSVSFDFIFLNIHKRKTWFFEWMMQIKL